MNDSRFDELTSRLLDEELTSAEMTELAELVRDNRQRLDELRSQLQAAEMLAQSEDEIRASALFLATVESKIDEDAFVSSVRSKLDASDIGDTVTDRSTVPVSVRSMSVWRWTAATIAAAALLASLYFQQPNPPRQIAKVTGLSGSLQWTGDGGRVVRDLRADTQLSGGTIQGMAPDSWFELQFNDGSTVTISGHSMLTFSDYDQKELHLKEGNLSCDVMPQPAGKPMLIHTRLAVLEVLGTKFDVEAELAATVLNVTEGKVRVRRLSDSSTVDVPAKHRVTAAADRDMSPERVPDTVTRWKSRLHLGPDGTYGKWSPAANGKEAALSAIPYSVQLPHRTFTIYTESMGVSRGDSPPVILQTDSQIKVRGRIQSARKMYFGVTLRSLNGEFAGRFQTTRPGMEFRDGEAFELTVPLQEFTLDPSLNEARKKLPGNPFDLVVESIWCHTLDKPAGLKIVEVELATR